MYMITGDYGLTARSIASEVGIVGSECNIIKGRELDSLSDNEVKKVLKSGSNIIFARAVPEHKMRIASILESENEIVAMTGDGVNDAPALRKADIGVAMGITGTDVAKEASDMVLTDDNFATIVAAIKEGRTIYENIRKFITYIFAHETAEIVPFILMVKGSSGSRSSSSSKSHKYHGDDDDDNDADSGDNSVYFWIFIIIIVLVLVFAVWFFFLRKG